MLDISIAANEIININDDIAFTSGVIPFLVIPQIWIGRVENIPFKKYVTGISSIDSVNERSAELMIAVCIFGSTT